ncbi:MAG: hypothetical protein ACHQIH_00420 [Ignavibacteria bacterium]
MRDSKLISVLKTMTKKEFRDFGRFVYSPFFNRLNNILKFFEELKKYYPDFANKEFTAENLYSKMFPDEPYSYSKMKLLESDMLKLAEEYLAFIGYKENSFETDKFLLTELKKRKLNKLFEINYKRANKDLENITYKDENYFFAKFYFENQNILNITNNKLYYEKDIIQKQLNYFIDYFLLQILRLYSFMTYQQKYLFGFDFDLRFLDEVTGYITRYPDAIKPLILLQYYDVMLSITGEENYYVKLKEMTEQYYRIIDINELYNIYVSLAKFMREKFDENSNKYIDEIFELYKTILGKGIFKSHFHMSNTFFINTADLALRKKDHLFLQDFINEYSGRLPLEHTADTLNYCNALKSFYEKNYESALGHLALVETLDISYKLIIKSLTLRIYYELNSIDSAESLIDTYRHLLLNNKLVTESLKNENLNFINYFSQLFRIKNEFNHENAEFLKKQISERKDIALKYWLIEKIDEMI